MLSTKLQAGIFRYKKISQESIFSTKHAVGRDFPVQHLQSVGISCTKKSFSREFPVQITPVSRISRYKKISQQRFFQYKNAVKAFSSTALHPRRATCPSVIPAFPAARSGACAARGKRTRGRPSGTKIYSSTKIMSVGVFQYQICSQ
jgi:hypothetical protein